MADRRAEDLGVPHAHHERAVASARLADHAAMVARREGPEAGVDEGDELLDQVVFVVPECGGIHVLAAAQVREAVGEGQDHRPGGTLGEKRVHPVCDSRRPGVVVQEHPPAPGESAEAPRDRIALLCLVVSGRKVEEELPDVGIAGKIPLEGAAHEVLAPDRAARDFHARSLGAQSSRVNSGPRC